MAVVLLGLLWYVSSVHHSRFYLEVDDNRVTVERGLYLPFGTAKYAPTTAYDAFTVPPGIAPEMTGAMSHEELDRVLRDLFVRVAKKEIDDLDRGDPERAEAMLLKAHKLRHTTALEDRELLDMLGDVSFRRGLLEVRGVQERFDEAVREFRMAARRGSLRFKNADQWATVIARQRDEIRQLARTSGLDPDRVLARQSNDFKGLLPPLPTEPAPAAEPTPAKAPDAGAP
ncbi:MAG: hypothetical protein H6702_13725 [Myxococcales bacterium]|nr:hypothetical protein [Myxococcales bacterium]